MQSKFNQSSCWYVNNEDVTAWLNEVSDKHDFAYGVIKVPFYQTDACLYKLILTLQLF